MDKTLVAWGRAVKARRRLRWPPLWLFTDPVRTPDVLAAIDALPQDWRRPGLCGVVFRHDGTPGGAALLCQVARRCRQRRIVISVAGEGARPPGAGQHQRGASGRPDRRAAFRTSSAHSAADLRRALGARVTLAFLSPAFATASHPNAPALGPLVWALLARRARLPVACLGGITGTTVRRLPPRIVAAVGAIGALTP